MIKKIIFILFILFICYCLNNVLKYNQEIIFYISSYEIRTSLSILFLIYFIIQLLIYLSFYIICILFNKNFKSFDKNKNKLERNFHKYINLISESIIYKNMNNIKESFKKIKEANKIFNNTNLSRVIESEIYFINKDYDKSKKIFKEIDDKLINLDLIYLKLNLYQEIENNNREKIQDLSEKLLSVEKTNELALKKLFDIYYINKNWNRAIDIFNIGLKQKIFNINKLKNKISFLYRANGKQLYQDRNYNEAKNNFKKSLKLDNYSLETSIMLSKTYLNLNRKNDALKIIEKIWKYKTNFELLNIYFFIKEKNLKNIYRLYKINSKSFETNILLAEYFYKEKNYSKAREYIKIAENIDDKRKDLYQLMLKIEEKDNGSSALKNNIQFKINTLKNKKWKCKVCKKEFESWQEECDNCFNIDSIEY